MFPLFETICIKEGKICKAELHQARYEKSYQQYYHEFPKDNIIASIHIPNEFKKGLVKAKISYNQNENIVEYSRYSIQNIKTIQLVRNDEIDYTLKYSNRDKIDELYQMRGKCDDVLIVKKSFITDTSYCNIVFFDGEKWITPDLPLLKGVERESLLKNKKIISQRIKEHDLTNFTHFKLINAVRSFDVVEAVDIRNIIF